MLKRFCALRDALLEDSTAVTAMVTDCRGSTPRSPGALLVLCRGKAPLGTVGGGQSEYDSLQDAFTMLTEPTAEPQIRWHQCLSTEELQQMGEAAGGEMQILLLRWEEKHLPLAEAVVAALQRGEDASLAVQYDALEWQGELLPQLKTETAPGRFTMKLAESGRCYVFGAGHVSQALVPLLSSVDFACTVLDERAEFANAERFPTAGEIYCGALPPMAKALSFTPNDAIIIMTRGHQGDYEILQEALKSPAWYIGMVGSRRKRDAGFALLRELGFTDADLARVRTPIGLAIDAETPAEIAVSIAAELIQKRAQRRKGD